MAQLMTKPTLPNQTILITGGSGLVGTRLSELLVNSGYEVTHLSRRPTSKKHKSYQWNPQKNEIDPEAIKTADAIIHLAGAGVADKRWTKSWKEEIYNSRINSTKLLYEAVRNHNSRLKHFISASAIGYYGWDTGEERVNEDHRKGEGFLADVVADWEQEVSKFDDLQIPNTKVRVGVVLSNQGGALLEIAKPIKWGLGAPLGSGKQYMSWIHIEDLCNIFIHLLEGHLEGSYNATAPNPVTNKQLTREIASNLNKSLFLPNVPSFMLKLLVGEMAVMLVGGSKVSSKKIADSGFNFQYPSLDSAVKDLLK